jgi:hypothetical protein
MVQGTSQSNRAAAAAAAGAPDGEMQEPVSELGQAMVGMLNRLDTDPTTVPGDMHRAGLLTAAVGAGIAAVGVAVDSRAATVAGLAGTAVGLALAGYSSRGIDQATVRNATAIKEVASLTAEGIEQLGQRIGAGQGAPTAEPSQPDPEEKDS